MNAITAQVSVYPLRQESLAPVISETLQVLRESALEVKPDTMSTLLVGDEITIFSALQQAFHHAAERGQVVMVVTFSNACPVPGKRDESFGKTSEQTKDTLITYDPATPAAWEGTDTRSLGKPATLARVGGEMVEGVATPLAPSPEEQKAMETLEDDRFSARNNCTMPVNDKGNGVYTVNMDPFTCGASERKGEPCEESDSRAIGRLSVG